ncbi:MAG: hypothetical protein Kow0058_19310 [Roseovarius sp.]
MARLAAIWASFCRLPLAVRLWVALILVPVNAAAILFVGAPGGGWVALLAIGGMLPNLVIMLHERGFSRLMALPHLLIWTPLMVVLAGLLADPALVGGAWRRYLLALLAVDAVSLAFDARDLWRWWRGERAIA